MVRFSRLYGIMLCGVLIAVNALAAPTSGGAPAISALLKPEVYRRVVQDREVMTHASLEEIPGPPAGLKRYAFYAAIVVRASMKQTHDAFVDYRLYQKIPYVDHAHYQPQTGILTVRGGIWKFRLASTIQLKEVSERWVQFEILHGHFRGMKGDLLFESLGEKDTIAFFRGETTGTTWPPAFVIERGAEVVFSFTGRYLKKFIESEKANGASQGEEKHDPQVPRPRSYL